MSINCVWTVLLACLSFNSVLGYNINITKFGNCDEIQEIEVKLLSVAYEYVNTMCDTVHGKYIVYNNHTVEKYELWITVYQCDASVVGQCNEKPVKFIEPLECSRFHSDDTGPWYMIAQAMEGSKCGEKAGEFQLDTAILKPQYLTNYLNFDESMPKYRIQMLFHRVGSTEEQEKLHVRGCLNMQFDLLY